MVDRRSHCCSVTRGLRPTSLGAKHQPWYRALGAPAFGQRSRHSSMVDCAGRSTN